ncbi:MAG: hypothetical protein KDJ52_31755 [Anaerolineae bacterium]|nr:hypothetical protein [Anaerolineae bacterium]
MANDVRFQFQDELGAHEHLLWSGRPKTGLMLRSSDIFLVPFSLIWGGFAIMWEIGVITSGAPLFFMLWGIPFVLVGLYLIGGRFFVDAWQRTSIYYALTNERVIILSGLLNRSVKSLSVKTLSEITLDKKSNGTGTITFGPIHPLGRMYSGFWWPGTGRYVSPAFEMIDHAQEVYHKIREAQKKV